MEEILKIIEKYTNPKMDSSQIRAEDSLADLGIDSLNFLMLILDIEALSNSAKLDPKVIAKLKTVKDILDMANV